MIGAFGWLAKVAFPDGTVFAIKENLASICTSPFT